MASKSYINTIASLAMSKILGEYIWEIWSTRPNNKTMKRICQRIQADAMEALHPYLNDAGLCQYDAKAQAKVMQKLERVNESFDSNGEELGCWVNFNLAQLDDLLARIKDVGRRESIERLIYGIKALARYIDRDMDDYRNYERANKLSNVWEAA